MKGKKLHVNDLYINSSITLKEALSRLDATAQGVLLLVDERECLIRTVTDGDIRRLFRGCS